MSGLRSGASCGVTGLLAFFLASPAPRVAAQASPDPGRPHKSVYGKLSKVDTARNGVVMTDDSGKRLAWRFDARVIAEAANFKPGDPMIVIYRQISASEKRVTAVAFPGSVNAARHAPRRSAVTRRGGG